MEKTLEKLVLVRSFAVAPDKVWRAWIDAGAMRVWFGQAEAPTWQADWDVRAGGNYRWFRSLVVIGCLLQAIPGQSWLTDTPIPTEAQAVSSPALGILSRAPREAHQQSPSRRR